MASHLAISVRESKQMRLELAAESWQTVRFQNRRRQIVPDGRDSWAESTASVYSSSARNLKERTCTLHYIKKLLIIR